METSEYSAADVQCDIEISIAGDNDAKLGRTARTRFDVEPINLRRPRSKMACIKRKNRNGNSIAEVYLYFSQSLDDEEV